MCNLRLKKNFQEKVEGNMIQAVTGIIEGGSITKALPHEHILSDLRPLAAPLDNGIFDDKVSLSNHGALSRNPYAVLDNALLADKEAAISEFHGLKRAGVNLVADVTTADFGRDVKFMKELSEKTGVNIIAGCGCYIDCAVAEELKKKPVSELRDIIIGELTVGIGESGIKAGVIGEVGSSEQMTECEYKFIQAASEAQSETGFGMHIHACLWNREGLAALKHAIKCGANPEKICVDHSDVLLDEGYIMGILEQGAYVEFDDFGKEFYVDRWNRNLLKHSFAYDTERVKFIRSLINRGYINQILVSNDICLKSMMHAYGGWGYDHIAVNIEPMMEDFGISAEDIDTIVRKNPVRFLERG